MSYFVFMDCETTGLPRNYKAPASDVGNWPRIVQIAWVLADESGKEEEARGHIIQPSGFTIPARATEVHGIDTERAMREGIELEEALDKFVAAVRKPNVVLVAHNISFDLGCIGAEFIRITGADPLDEPLKFCTMLESTNICKLPGRYGYKWPSLAELHSYLFKEPLEDAHEALADVRACARCFFEMRDRGLI